MNKQKEENAKDYSKANLQGESPTRKASKGKNNNGNNNKYGRIIKNFELLKDIFLIVLSLVAIIVSICQNRISDESMRSSNRPYICVKDIGNCMSDSKENRFYFYIDITYSNFGITPAYNINVFYNVGFFGSNFTDNPIYRFKSLDNKIILGSNEDDNIQAEIDTTIGNDIFKNSATFIYIFGFITYGDIFKRTHRTEFCAIQRNGNQFHFHKKHNNAR